MKKLIFLLFITSELFGQQELFHAQNKGLLLDEFPNAAAAYSLRRVNSRYTGPLIRVRKDSTGQLTQDIGTIGEALDTVALKAFAGANSCYVSIWFDQSGNARDAAQTTATAQPRIVNAGVIDKLNKTPAMFFDGSNDFLGAANVADWTFLHYSTAYTNFTVARAGIVTDPENVYTIWGTTLTATGSLNGSYLIHDTRSTSNRDRILVHQIVGNGQTVSLNIQTAGSTNANSQFLSLTVSKPTNTTASERSALGTNNAPLQKNNTNATFLAINATAKHPLRFGTSEGSGNVNVLFLLGNIQESIFYPKDQTSELPIFRNNINGFYAIY